MMTSKWGQDMVILFGTFYFFWLLATTLDFGAMYCLAFHKVCFKFVTENVFIQCGFFTKIGKRYIKSRLCKFQLRKQLCLLACDHEAETSATKNTTSRFSRPKIFVVA